MDVTLSVVQKKFLFEKTSLKRLWSILSVVELIYREGKISISCLEIFERELVYCVMCSVVDYLLASSGESSKIPLLINHVAHLLILCDKVLFYRIAIVADEETLTDNGLKRVEVTMRESVEFSTRELILGCEIGAFTYLCSFSKNGFRYV